MNRNYQPLAFSDNPLILLPPRQHWSWKGSENRKVLSPFDKAMRLLLVLSAKAKGA
jgi:hypothetical protein